MDVPARRTTAGTAWIDKSIHKGIRKRATSVCEENGSTAASTSGLVGNMRLGARRTIGHYTCQPVSRSGDVRKCRR
jgi:hypothetical protein